MFNATELTQLCRQAGHSEDSIADAMSRFEFVERPCTQLEVGKWYRWVGESERPEWFSSWGEMDYILDGKPRLCILSEPSEDYNIFIFAKFDDMKASKFEDGGWWWHDIPQNFVECLPLQQLKSDTAEAVTMPPMVG